MKDLPEPARIERQVDLDLPGETARQARILFVWLACLVLAVIASSIAAGRVPQPEDRFADEAPFLAEVRAARVRVGLPVGLLLPAILTLAIQRWHRRGGGHARGISVDVTPEGELRIWGRGYGTRIDLASADVSLRLVDAYAGRLGAWRQLRLRARATKHAGGAFSEIDIATPAVESDMNEGLPVEGGEADAVELTREDFEAIRAAAMRFVKRADRSADQGGSQAMPSS